MPRLKKNLHMYKDYNKELRFRKIDKILERVPNVYKIFSDESGVDIRIIYFLFEAHAYCKKENESLYDFVINYIKITPLEIDREALFSNLLEWICNDLSPTEDLKLAFDIYKNPASYTLPECKKILSSRNESKELYFAYLIITNSCDYDIIYNASSLILNIVHGKEHCINNESHGEMISKIYNKIVELTIEP